MCVHNIPGHSGVCTHYSERWEHGQKSFSNRGSILLEGDRQGVKQKNQNNMVYVLNANEKDTPAQGSMGYWFQEGRWDLNWAVREGPLERGCLLLCSLKSVFEGTRQAAES